MATPAIFNINYYRGDTYEFTIKPLDQDGNAVVLTGTPTFTVATSRGPAPNPPDGWHDIECTATLAGNTIECKITPTQGKEMTGLSYVYDVELAETPQGPTTKVQTYLTGNLTVTEDVSNQGRFSVFYDPNGGVGEVIDANTYYKDDVVTVEGQGNLEYVGYTFVSWNTQADGLGDTYAPAATFNMPEFGQTLYAQWVAV